MDAERLVTWLVRVVDASGAPARHVQLRLPTARRYDEWLDHCAVPADGGLELRLPAGPFAIHALSQDGFGVATLDDTAEAREITIELQPPAPVTLSVRGADGAPVARARFPSRGIGRPPFATDPIGREPERLRIWATTACAETLVATPTAAWTCNCRGTAPSN